MHKTAWSEATFTVKGDGAEPATDTVKDRVRRALENQFEAGPNDEALMLNPTPRWAADLYKAHSSGVAVETLTELYAGAFPRTYARYHRRNLMERVA